MTILLQGATNSVAQFVQVVNLILEKLNPKIAMLFFDNIGIKGLYRRYNKKKTFFGI